MSFSLPPALNLPEDVHECLTRYIEEIQQSWSADLGGLILFGSVVRGDFIVGRSNINVLLVIKKQSAINFRWYGSGLPWLQRVTEN